MKKIKAIAVSLVFTVTSCGGGGDVSTVKKGRLQLCSTFTVEELFDVLLEKPKWQRVTENGIDYVNVNGITAGGGKPQNVLAQFWVRNEEFGGQAFEIDGKNADGENIITTACNRTADKAAEKARAIQADPIKDSRDGKTYKTVKIGEQVWMAENLNIEMGNSVCYGNDPANCQKYGRLYDWNTAMKACPKGWHLPSDDELGKLAGRGGKYLKAKSGWNNNGNGTDNYGFSALPGGHGGWNGFFNVGSYGYWWSASESNDDRGYRWYIHYKFVENRYYEIKSNLFSVRCLQD
ncbi:MAG: fibrobacter succinogenes major paralogous domain-containing protein [Fibromonadaceae bacterium]|nr:fibrobacter succinogenes major paralogous domain-containing protein [Fibromonadaceae bacterium]